MTTEERIRKLHDEAVQQLVEAHKERVDEPLILAVRYRIDDPNDIYLMEILGEFPGGDDDELLGTDFERSAELLILGTLHISLGSPAQMKSALRRNDAIIDEVRAGRVVHDDGSPVALELKQALGL